MLHISMKIGEEHREMELILSHLNGKDGDLKRVGRTKIA